jgi:hypothetical protein
MDRIRAAIARITVGNRRGTGFLVSPNGLVLTALHVVAGDSPSDPPVIDDGPINLRFGDARQAPEDALHETTATLTEHYSVPEDWALLQCAAAPQGTSPLPLARLMPTPNEVQWDAWGFSTSDPNLGTWYRGVVVPLAEQGRLELTSVEAAAGAGGMIAGLSGAPMLVGGQVVGIVLSALLVPDAQGNLRSLEGKIYARHLESVVQNGGGKLAWDDDGLPILFESDIESYFDNVVAGKRREVASRLDIDTANVSDEKIIRRISRALATRPFSKATTALAALAQTSPQAARELVRIAAALSLHPSAVEMVAMAGRRQASKLGAWLTCEGSLPYELFVQRANYEDFLGLWRKKMHVVNIKGAEVSADSVIAKVSELLEPRPPSSANTRKVLESSKQQRERSKQQPFCLVLCNVLAIEDLAKVCETFQKARVLVVTEEPVSLEERARLDRVLFVTPELTEEFTMALNDAIEDFDIEERAL